MLITTSLVVLVAGSVVGEVAVEKKLGRIVIVDIEIIKIVHTILPLALGGGDGSGDGVTEEEGG